MFGEYNHTFYTGTPKNNEVKVKLAQRHNNTNIYCHNEI